MSNRATIQQVRRKRWERQRAEAIRREQTELCYRQYVPPQVSCFQAAQANKG